MKDKYTSNNSQNPNYFIFLLITASTISSLYAH